MLKLVGALLLASILTDTCNGRFLRAIAPTLDNADLFRRTTISSALQQGIGPYIQDQNYTSFLGLVQASNTYSSLYAGAWSQGVTNNTVLVPTNAAIDTGFATLGRIYNTPTNVTEYLQLANSSVNVSDVNGALQTLFDAIINSHVLTTPLNLYATPAILTATNYSSYLLPGTNLSSLNSPAAYTDANQNIIINQPTGLVRQPITVPKFYAQQRVNANATIPATNILYLYEADAMLVASSVEGSSSPDGGNVLQALTTIQQSSVTTASPTG